MRVGTKRRETGGCRLILVVVLLLSLGHGGTTQAEETAYPVPLFREAHMLDKPPDLLSGGRVRLLVDDGFPPFHFRDATGHLTGLSIDLALAACAELKLTCE